jgi:hypothetical protein
VDWIDIAQDREQQRALVNTLLNLQVPYNEWLHNWWLKKGSGP